MQTLTIGESKYLQAWMYLDPKHILSSKILTTYREDNYNQIDHVLKGDLAANLGSLLVTLLHKPRGIRREFGHSQLDGLFYYTSPRIDLVEVIRQQPRKAWEFKTTFVDRYLQSEQIRYFSNTFGDNFNIIAYYSPLSSSHLTLYSEIIQDLRLESKFEEFFHDSLNLTNNLRQNKQAISRVTHITESVIDSIHFKKNPADEILPALESAMDRQMEYIYNPCFNGNMLLDSSGGKARIIQHPARPHLTMGNFNSISHISIQSRHLKPSPVQLVLCWSIPDEEYVPQDIILRDQIIVDDGICEFLDPVLAHSSNNSNFWNLLNCFNIPIQTLAHTKKLVVNVE